MQLAAKEGFKVEERPYGFEEWQADAKSGRLREAFACGTAAVIAGIGTIKHKGGEFAIGNSGDGVTTAHPHPVETLRVGGRAATFLAQDAQPHVRRRNGIPEQVDPPPLDGEDPLDAPRPAVHSGASHSALVGARPNGPRKRVGGGDRPRT